MKYITVICIIVVALVFCFSEKAYCFSLGDLQQAAQQAAVAANKTSKGTSSTTTTTTTTTNANANAAQPAPSGVTDNNSFEFQAGEFEEPNNPTSFKKYLSSHGISITNYPGDPI